MFLCLPGSRRFGKLIQAARAKETLPPADMRYLKKGTPSKAEKKDDTSRARVISYLQGIYDSVAETLPDVRDDTCDTDPVVTLEVPELVDPYVKAMNEAGGSDEAAPSSGAKRKGDKKVRTRKFSIQLHTERKHAQEDRYLPPGHIRDFWEQMKCSEALTGNEKPVAFSTFWRIWNQEYPFLKFRPTSSHSQCGTCMRHKMLIRGLTGHMKARQEQINQYISHLQSQYRDRICYWELRGKSRLKTNDVLIILDGMDQQKFAYPRSPSFLSKELQGLNRPRSHISGVIVHGRFILFTVSPANVPKDANSCIETTAHCLQSLSQETDLSKITLHVQSDNTSREVKNNHYLMVGKFGNPPSLI